MFIKTGHLIIETSTKALNHNKDFVEVSILYFTAFFENADFDRLKWLNKDAKPRPLYEE